MGNLVLNGSTSGSITVAPTAVAGSNTLTLPAKTGDIITSADSGTVSQTMLASGVVGQGPSFRAYGSANQSSLASNSTTKIQLNTKTGSGGWDTASCFDATTNYRFTPNVAGYYSCSCAAALTGGANNLSNHKLYFYKNGSIYSTPWTGSFSTGLISINGSDVIYCDGSTDYIEFYVSSASGGTYTITAGTTLTYATATLIRSA